MIGNKFTTDKEFNKKLLTLVFPIAFQQFMLAVVSASDAIMLGLISQDALSAVSLAGQVQFVFNLFLASLTIGTSMFAAQYWGKGDREAMERILAFVLRISATVSAAFFIVTFCFPGTVMRIFTSDGPLLEGGILYLKAVGASYLFCGISQIYLCIMKNTGRAAKSTLISTAAVLLNIVLNAVLIFGLWGAPKLGIAGIFCAGGDSNFGFVCDIITLWCITVPLGLAAAFIWNLPVPAVYLIVSLDEIIKLPAVYKHYKKFIWVKNLTTTKSEQLTIKKGAEQHEY